MMITTTKRGDMLVNQQMFMTGNEHHHIPASEGPDCSSTPVETLELINLVMHQEDLAANHSEEYDRAFYREFANTVADMWVDTSRRQPAPIATSSLIDILEGPPASSWEDNNPEYPGDFYDSAAGEQF